MKPNCSPAEKIFSVQFTESELVMVISALLQMEHEAIRMAILAKKAGNLKHMNARQQSAAKALALADRLVKIGALV